MPEDPSRVALPFRAERDEKQRGLLHAGRQWFGQRGIARSYLSWLIGSA
jgi:hypothetical protein